MNIITFDSLESEISAKNMLHHLHSYILIVDKFYTFANNDWTNYFNIDFDTISDEMIIDYGKIAFRNHEQSLLLMNQIASFLPMVQKAKRLKHKDKDMLKAIGQYKRTLETTRKTLKKSFETFIETSNLQELRKFIADDIWQVPFSYVIADPKKEDVFIQPIYQKMLERDNLFGLDEKVEEFITHTMLDESEPTDFDFIKIPLWEVPLAVGLSYNQIKYTRNDLQPALLPFKTNLKELSEALIDINFLPENLERIKQLCREKLNEHIPPVKQSLNDSLYLSHLKNQSAENTNSKLFLGIASAETLLNYFDKIKLVQPYVISEIKQQIQRHFDMKACCIFAYLKVHPSNQIQIPANDSI